MDGDQFVQHTMQADDSRGLALLEMTGVPLRERWTEAPPKYRLQ